MFEEPLRKIRVRMIRQCLSVALRKQMLAIYVFIGVMYGMACLVVMFAQVVVWTKTVHAEIGRTV